MELKNILSAKRILGTFVNKSYIEGVYADTPQNRKLGRVGMSYATANKQEESKDIKEVDWDKLANKGTWDEINSYVTEAYNKLGKEKFLQFFKKEDFEKEGDKIYSKRNAKNTCKILKEIYKKENKNEKVKFKGPSEIYRDILTKKDYPTNEQLELLNKKELIRLSNYLSSSKYSSLKEKVNKLIDNYKINTNFSNKNNRDLHLNSDKTELKFKISGTEGDASKESIKNEVKTFFKESKDLENVFVFFNHGSINYHRSMFNLS